MIMSSLASIVVVSLFIKDSLSLHISSHHGPYSIHKQPSVQLALRKRGVLYNPSKKPKCRRAQQGSQVLHMTQSRKNERTNNGQDNQNGNTNGFSSVIEDLNNGYEGKYSNKPFPPFPTEAFEIDTLAEDNKTPIFFPELKVMDYLRSSRLLKERSYARRDAFSSTKIDNTTPTIQDLSSPPSSNFDKLWVSSWFRLFLYSVSWVCFPFVTKYVYHLASATAGGQESIVAFNLSSFLPAVSLIYGTFISLTLSILYDRQKFILDKIECETSLLAVITQNMLTIFEEDGDLDSRNDYDTIVEVGQSIADYVRVLVMESRGTELMTIMYSDPLIDLMKVLSTKKKSQLKATGKYDSLIDATRSDIKDMFKVRAQRLGGESSSLPPTHFVLMSILTGILLASFVLSTIPTLSDEGLPSFETKFMFSVFTTVYVVFYTFAVDLNNPFKGVYQLRRSGPAAHLLQTKLLLLNDSRLKNRILFDR